MSSNKCKLKAKLVDWSDLQLGLNINHVFPGQGDGLHHHLIIPTNQGVMEIIPSSHKINRA